MSCPSRPPRPRRAPRRARAPGGFTLIELMVSLVLLGVILTLIYTSFYQISNGSKRISEELAEQQELRLLLTLIGEDLQAAQYFERFTKDGNASGMVAVTDFVGNRKMSKLDFHANVPARFHRQVDPAADPLMHELAYWVEEDERDREVLVLKRREDFYLDDDMHEGGVTSELVKGVESFLVEFLPPAIRQSEFEDQWEEEWDSSDKTGTGRMPMAMRITLARRATPQARLLQETLEVNLQAALRVGQ
ncbi:MAG: prepilin-type N-terminal cleavage/methylation domain-containing protein [SAR324 cluster bacterium]|nr:prepilin-type N-terminal cleavage/methylation domain-containing protein [SAR324 cluster bacterium]